MPDKAIELLIDVATKAQQDGVQIITEDFVHQVVSEKQAHPLAPLVILSETSSFILKTVYTSKVIRQQAALNAIARTMRRARSRYTVSR